MWLIFAERVTFGLPGYASENRFDLDRS